VLSKAELGLQAWLCKPEVHLIDDLVEMLNPALGSAPSVLSNLHQVAHCFPTAAHRMQWWPCLFHSRGCDA
jgi:hypothetical protein